MSSYKNILADLKKKIYHPVYVLHGEEPYFIDKIADYIEDNVLTEAEKGFNLSVVYGKEAEPDALLDMVQRYPMMATYQVVILKEAQQMKGLDKLAPYLEKPVKSTLFVICHKHKKLDQRTNFAKLAKKKAVVFESKPLYENQVPEFIQQMAAADGLKIDGRSTALLLEYLGSDLSKIEREVEKLAINLDEGLPVTPELIEKYIGVSKDYNIFEYTKALANRDSERAFKIVKYFIGNSKLNPPIKVLGFIAPFFTKAFVYKFMKGIPDKQVYGQLGTFPAQMPDLKAFANNYSAAEAEKVLNILTEYDLKAKGVDHTGSDKSPLLLEMTYRILN